VSVSRNEADLASVSCLDDRVRGRLCAFVSGRSEPVGRDEAAAAVGIGRALAVYHLGKLVESGLLAPPTGGRRAAADRGPAGRPRSTPDPAASSW
jgi:predicted ArsR family transcriptional regulator